MNSNRLPKIMYPLGSDLRLIESQERDREVIRAMQQKISRNPLRDFIWRKPWKSKAIHPRWNRPRDVWEWLKNAHDCQDPAVGCSCSGGFRFP